MGNFKKTALHIAVENSSEMSMKLLLTNGADVTLKDVFGFDIYDKAQNRGKFDFIEIFQNVLK